MSLRKLKKISGRFIPTVDECHLTSLDRRLKARQIQIFIRYQLKHKILILHFTFILNREIYTP